MWPKARDSPAALCSHLLAPGPGPCLLAPLPALVLGTSLCGVLWTMAHGCRREAVAICGHLREPHRCLGWPWCGGGGGGGGAEVPGGLQLSWEQNGQAVPSRARRNYAQLSSCLDLKTPGTGWRCGSWWGHRGLQEKACAGKPGLGHGGQQTHPRQSQKLG